MRLINGRALEVLPRLADESYDMVVVDAIKAEYTDYLVEALRLLRCGGIVAFDGALRGGKVVDPKPATPSRWRCASWRGSCATTSSSCR